MTKVKIQITITHGDQIMTVADTSPITLSGDIRRHKGQIARHLVAQFSQLATSMAVRFGKEGFTSGPTVDGHSDVPGRGAGPIAATQRAV